MAAEFTAAAIFDNDTLFANDTMFGNGTTPLAAGCNHLQNRTEIEFLEHHIPTVIAISRILPPIWWIIGIIGNIIALLVWLQPKMRHSSGCYLAALAVTDLCFLILSIVFETNYLHKPILDKHILCQWFAISYLSVQYMSPVFVLAFTVERYLSVCHPFRMVNFNQSNIRATILAVLGLAFFCISVSGVNGFFWTVDNPNGPEECDLRESEIQTWTIFAWTTEMFIFGLVPLAVLILNVLVIIEVRHISNLERRNMRTRSIDRRSTTLMLLGVSFYQIFTVLPATVMYTLYTQFTQVDTCLSDAEISVDAAWADYFRYKAARTVIQNLCMSHYAVNFFIYVMTGKLFRKQLYEMFIIFCCKEKLLYLTTKTGAYTSTRTTRMSLTSYRGSVGKGRRNNTPKSSDPCNNDTDVGNKNTNSMYSTAELEASTIDGSGHPTRPGATSSAGAKLLPCVQESDAEDVEGQSKTETAASETRCLNPVTAKDCHS